MHAKLRFSYGTMGSGKSLSMTFDAIKLKEKFPDMKLISNLKINGIEEQKNYETVEELLSLLEESQYNKHTLVIIDEALTYFAENGGIDPALMNKISSYFEHNSRASCTIDKDFPEPMTPS